MSNSADIQESGEAVRVPPVIAEAGPAVPNEKPRTLAVRIWSIFFLGVCGSILVLGAMMHPSEKGYGTHSENLRLPECGMLQMTGYPCPTCGCTTAVTHLAHGNLWMAVKTQPFGAAVGLVSVALVVLSLIGVVTGRWVWPDTMWLAFHWLKIVMWSAGLLVAAWAYKAMAIKMGW